MMRALAPLPRSALTSAMHVDLLAFGPHPDDIEIGMAGTVAKHAALGARVGLCDLTRGERGSNGTPEERVQEGEAAARVLGATWRVNLALPDGGLSPAREQVTAIAELIRRAQPALLAIPHVRDRHPDHGAAHHLLVRAIFDAGLRRFPASGDPWRARAVCSYFINDHDVPSFVIDVSAFYQQKREALACYRSQFETESPGAVATRLTSPLFAQLVESRDSHFGARADVRWAEGFVVQQPLRLDHLFAAFELEVPSPAARASS
jgi:N-acetylglucosamine malate deacetylase 1